MSRKQTSVDHLYSVDQLHLDFQRYVHQMVRAVAGILTRTYGKGRIKVDVGSGMTLKQWVAPDGHVWLLSDDFIGLYSSDVLRDQVSVHNRHLWGAWLQAYECHHLNPASLSPCEALSKIYSPEALPVANIYDYQKWLLQSVKEHAQEHLREVK
jgi:hypothetical protein